MINKVILTIFTQACQIFFLYFLKKFKVILMI